MRLHAYLILLPHIPEDSNIKSHKDLLKLRWDEEEGVTRIKLVEPDWDELDKRYKEIRSF